MLNSLEQLRRNKILEADSTCLNHIFCHSWHSRIWTLQEVAFSRDCQIVCGKETISWDFYVKASRFLIREEFIDELDAPAWKSSLGIKIRDDIRKSLRSQPSERDSNQTIEVLTTNLTHIRHLQATNPKDKIYGLYGVFTNLGLSLPAPDYGKSLEKIYEEACVAIILLSGSLQILEYACSNARAQNLPSWVVDWQDEDVTLKTPSGSATEGSRISQIDLSTLSPASGQLLVRGVIVGSITTRAESDFATSQFPSGSLPILNEENYGFTSEVESLRMLLHRLRLFREWMHLVDGVPSPHGDEDFGDIFRKLVTFSTNSGQSPFSSESEDARLWNAWVNLLQCPDTRYDLSHADKVAETWKSADDANSHHWTPELFQCSVVAAAILLAATSTSKDGQVPAELLDFTAHVAGDLGNRALILVRDVLLEATLAGTAFHMARVDDCVVLLEGADNPVVLRRKGDQWSFVGPAFVVGIMDGEGWLEEDLQDFLLI